MSEIPPEKFIVLSSHGGVENVRGGVDFLTGDALVAALAALGLDIKLPAGYGDRPVTLSLHPKDARAVVDVEGREASPPDGWGRVNKKTKRWRKIFPAKLIEPEDLPAYDDEIRCVAVHDGGALGRSERWQVKMRETGLWVQKPLGEVKWMLMARKHTPTEAEIIAGALGWRPWWLVDLPFQPVEDANKRTINSGAQFKFPLPNLADGEKPYHPHWDKIYDHIGTELTPILKDLAWAQRCGIRTGADYLRAWSACAFRCPFEQSPYLFLFGSENCGKSIFFESLKLLVTKGVVRADHALTRNNEFNGELAGAIICAVEEKDISQSPDALGKIKDWVTGRTICIRKMRHDARDQPNSTHWVQTANSPRYCPVFPGDTRIMPIRVPDLLEEQIIPKSKMETELEKEGPHFLHTLMHLDLPPVMDRLQPPVVATPSKALLQEDNAGEHAVALVNWIKTDTTLTAKQLVETVQAHWPRNGRVVRRLVEEAEPYLRQHGIKVEIDKRDNTLIYIFRKVAACTN